MDIFKIIELIGVLFWIVYLTLAVWENIWCWIFGILASAITVILFYHAKIYLESVLNIYYIGAGMYGWYHWMKMRKNVSSGQKNNTPVAVWSWTAHLISFVTTAMVCAALGTLMKRYTDSPRPYVDAATASFSFLATFMETRKVLTCWIYWFVINIVLVALQIDRGIYLYAGLSGFFVVMSVPGFLKWRKSYLASRQ